MLRLKVFVILLVSCNSFPFHIQTEFSYGIPEQNAHIPPPQAKDQDLPYIVSIEKLDDHSVLLEISAQHELDITGLSITSKAHSSSDIPSQFLFLDQNGKEWEECKLENPQKKIELIWKTEGFIKEDIVFEATIWHNVTTYWTGISKTFKHLNALPPNPSCGKNIGCFSNCTGEECDYIISWAKLTNDTINFKIQTKITPGISANSWAAIGFSSNQSMPGSSIIMCINSKGSMRAELGYNVGHEFVALVTPPGELSLVSAEVVGNILQCEIKRKIVSDEVKIFDLRKSWYLLFARGNVSNDIPLHHDFKTASSLMYNFQGPLVIADIIRLDPWCGKSKGCFFSCKSLQCDYLISWQHDNEYAYFDVQTHVTPGTVYNSWAAIGLSFDQEMDGSSIMMCMSEFGLMRTELGFTNGHTYEKIVDLQNSMTFLNGSTKDTIFRCSFKRKLGSYQDQIFDLRDTWYLLFSHGKLEQGFPQHHDFRIASSSRYSFTAPLINSVQSSQVSSIPPDPDCGKSKGCLTNCTKTDCEYIISWTNDAQAVTFQIQTKVMAGTIMNSYAAIGLSTNQSMPGTSVMMCLNINGQMSAEYGFTKGHEYSKLDDHKLTLVHSSTDGDIFRCTFQREINLMTDKIFSLRNEWFLLFAHGNVEKGIPVHHTNRTASDEKIDFLNSMEQQEIVGIPPDADCGKKKMCFTNCTQTDCHSIVSWVSDGKMVTFDLQAIVDPLSIQNAWVAIGLSTNMSMAGTNVMMCLSTNGQVSAQYGFTVKHEYQTNDDGQHKLTLVSSSVSNNILSCTIQREVDIATDKIFNLQDKWYLLFAWGPVEGGIPTHHVNKTSSGTMIDFLSKPHQKHDIIQKDHLPLPEVISYMDLNKKAPMRSQDFSVEQQVPYSIADDEPEDKSTTVLSEFSSVNECGTSKNCYHNCGTSNGCSYLISWLADSNDVIFNVTAKVEAHTGDKAWIGIGFSPNGVMPKSSLITCQNIYGNYTVEYGHSSDYQEYIQIKDEAPILLDSSANGDILQCSFRRPVISSNQWIFNLTQKWHIMFAYGPMFYLPANHYKMPKAHTFRVGDTHAASDFLQIPGTPVSSLATVAAKSQLSVIQDNGCGVTKGCFNQCSGGSCDFQVSWVQEGDEIEFTISAEITGRVNASSAWVAVGFSPNGKMPHSSFIMCLHVNGQYYSEYGYSTQYTQYMSINNITGPNITSSSVNGTILTCTMRRPITINSGQIFNLTEQWHILFAYGQVTLTGNGKPTPDYHSFKTGGAYKINFTDITFAPMPETTESSGTTPSGSEITPDNGCTVTKGCFDDCNSGSCTYLVTWEPSSDKNDVTFSISAKITSDNAELAWIGMGFSPDGNMPHSSFMLCLHANGNFTSQFGHSTQYTEYKHITDTPGPTIMSSSVNGNILRCTIKRPTVSSHDQIFNLTNDWHVLFAHGPVTVNNGNPTPGYHSIRVGGTTMINFLNVTSTPATTPKPSTSIVPSTTPPNSGAITPDPECEKTKGCFSRCSGSTCSKLLTWLKDGSKIKFEIQEQVLYSPENRWVAIGFSNDKNMGGASVVMCQHKTGGDTIVLGYNDGLIFSVLPQSNSTANMITGGSLSVTGNIIRCSFERQINSTNNKVYDLNKEWYILMGNGPISAGTPVQHEDFPIASDVRVNLSEFSGISGGVNTPTTIKIHGCLMIAAWILFSSIGIILARFFKKQWPSSTFMKQKIWFQIHRTCMVLAVLLCLAAFILILVENGGYKALTEKGNKSYVNLHPIFGIIVTCLAVLNPIIALFRCAPDHVNRPIFNWAHSIVGNSAHIFGAITVAFGLNIPKANVDYAANYVVITYAVAFVLVEFLLTRLAQQANTQVPRKPREDVYTNIQTEVNNSDQIDPKDGNSYNLSTTPSGDEEPGENSAMKFVLFLHFLAMSTCCIILMYLVIKSGETL